MARVDHSSRKLEIPTKKAALTLDQFEQMPNGGADHIAKYPIGGSILPVLDTDFRTASSPCRPLRARS